MKQLKLLSLFTLLVNISIAQTVNFETVSLDNKNIIQASFGLNMAAMANLEYGRVLAVKEKPFIVSANATLPFGEDVLDDYKLAINLSGNTFKKSNWAMPAHLGLFATTTENKMNRITSMGIHMSINPGYYRKTWFVATEITYDKFLLSHVKNSDHYKEVYYAEAKDSWYKNTGGNFNIGLTAGKTLKKGELNIRLGMITTEQLNLVLVPYFAQVGYRISFQ